MKSIDYSQAKARIRGLVLNQPTPYVRGSLEVDHAGLRHNIERWVAAKVPVIMITSGTSDLASMGEDEILELTRTTVQAVAGRAFVIACTSTWWLGQVSEFAQECEKIGADAVMLAREDMSYAGGGPGWATPQVIYDYHRAVAAACRIPLIYLSFLTGPKSIEVLKRVLEIPAVIGMKQEMMNYDQYSLLHDNFGDRLAVMCGAGGEIAYHAHQFGTVGSLTSVGQWAPEAEGRFVEQMLAGQWHEAQGHLARIIPFRRVTMQLGVARCVKHAMDVAGYVGGPVRRPKDCDLSDAEKARVSEAVRATGLI